MPSDLLVRDAVVVDGSGAPGVPADVLVDAGRIAAVEPPGSTGRDARTVVDAGGRVLCPGFVDLHAHSDLQLLAHPDHTAKVTQGVTCEVLGQDGIAFAPLAEPGRPLDAAVLAQTRRQVAGWNGDGPQLAGLEPGWATVAEYLDRLDRGVACHAAVLVPQGTLRLLVVGDADRPATPAELARMTAVLAHGLRDGAVGMSSGLTYTPGMFATTDELVALCRVVAAHGGYYAPHHRSYGHGALAAYAEMLDVAARAGCSLHLTHATMNFPENRGRAPELLALVDAALATGADVTLDSYPYLAGATTLAALLPSWTTAGGADAQLARLADPVVRQRIRHDLEVTGSDGCHGCPVDWTTIQVSGVQVPSASWAVGRTVADLAADAGRPPSDVAFDLLVEDRLATTVLQHAGDEANVQTVMRHRAHTGGSDAILVGERPHPRAWGTFPRYLGRYVRELGVLTLEDCVHHLTGRAARRLGLLGRGLVRPGYHADLVLFDPDRVRDTATYDVPRQQCEGIDWVLVAGVPVVRDGQRTDALPGRALRRTARGTTTKEDAA